MIEEMKCLIITILSALDSAFRRNDDQKQIHSPLRGLLKNPIE